MDAPATTQPLATPVVSQPAPAATTPAGWFKNALSIATGSNKAGKVDWDSAPAAAQQAKQVPPVNTLATPAADLIKAAEAHINVGSVVTPDVMKAIFDSSNPEAQQVALMAALNKTAQLGFLGAHQSATAAADTAINTRMAEATSKLPEQFKQWQTQQTAASDPLLSRPELAPTVNAATSMLRSKFPTASASEITALTSQYIKDTVFNGYAPVQAKTVSSKESVDWDKLLS
jgi:hypothetical protein